MLSPSVFILSCTLSHWWAWGTWASKGPGQGSWNAGPAETPARPVRFRSGLWDHRGTSSLQKAPHTSCSCILSHRGPRHLVNRQSSVLGVNQGPQQPPVFLRVVLDDLVWVTSQWVDYINRSAQVLCRLRIYFAWWSFTAGHLSNHFFFLQAVGSGKYLHFN